MFALVCAILLYYLIHEGSHVIVALAYGAIALINALLIVKIVYPAYKKSFSND